MIPFLFRADYIMHLWLGKVPSYAVEFAMSTVFISLTYALFEPIRTSVLATNRITKFMLYPEVFYLLVLPLGYFISKTFGNPLLLIIVIVGMDILTCIVRTIYALKVCPLKANELILKVIVPCLSVALLDSLLCYFIASLFPTSILGLLSFLVLNSIVLIIIIVMLGLNRKERNVCFSVIRKICKNLE